MRSRQHLIFLLGSSLAPLAKAALRINEISDKGTADVCNGNDWIEIYNSGPDPIDMIDGYVLHDDQGITDEDAFTFPPGTLAADDYMLLCTKMKLSVASDLKTGSVVLDDPSSPNFGISGHDTITLVQAQTIGSTGGKTYQVLSSVALPNTDSAFDVTYAYNATAGEFSYTSTPTPGTANINTRVKTTEEQTADHAEALAAQNALGTQFFGMDSRGYKVEDAMDDVLQLHMTMDDVDLQYMMTNSSFEVYRPFQSSRLTTVDGEEIVNLSSQGKIRTKGQSTLFMSICVATKTMPFQIDFAAFNETQSLFGTGKIYLRHHMGDYSFSRDYAYYRMLARFGLPHLRVRKVEFFINDEKMGYYSLIEAIDQEYVFARNFPNYDPTSFALYKVKSQAIGCGAYTSEEMAAAVARLGEENNPPYAFQRGEHRPAIEQLGLFSADKCLDNFVDAFYTDYSDAVLAYLRYDEDCADMLLGEEVIDRDLGNKKWDKTMHDFIDSTLRADKRCSKGCTNTNFAETADIENVLKTYAFYAVLVLADSPLMNGNNYYLVQSGEEANGGTGGWKMVAYDFNAARVVFCHNDVCNKRLVHWSIARPTCTALEESNLVGPLLSDPILHAKYIEYVREFVDTVFANETFIQELVDHQAAQDKYVRKDFWSFYGAFYDNELTPESSKWEETGDDFPLLPTMKARAEDVRAQLAAIDAGTFARGPHVGVNGDNEAWEYCPDWRSEEKNNSMCELGCKYEGCDMPGWTVESFCDEELGICYHGDADERCRGLHDGEKYEGMEDSSFCSFAGGISVKAFECAAPGAAASLETSGSRSFLQGIWVVFALSIGSLQLL